MSICADLLKCGSASSSFASFGQLGYWKEVVGRHFVNFGRTIALIANLRLCLWEITTTSHSLFAFWFCPPMPTTSKFTFLDGIWSRFRIFSDKNVRWEPGSINALMVNTSPLINVRILTNEHMWELVSKSVIKRLRKGERITLLFNCIYFFYFTFPSHVYVNGAALWWTVGRMLTLAYIYLCIIYFHVATVKISGYYSYYRTDFEVIRVALPSLTCEFRFPNDFKYFALLVFGYAEI